MMFPLFRVSFCSLKLVGFFLDKQSIITYKKKETDDQKADLHTQAGSFLWGKKKI
ncbi:hypothetical protein Hanom_Chr01g00012431 [Helianthus anomalus]